MSKFAGFSSVELTRPRKSEFDLSHQVRSSTRMGRLTPVMITEAVPSDTFRGSTEILLRLAPLLAPIYDMITLYVHHFFVPNRLLWDEWEEFITGGRLGAEAAPDQAPVPPFFDLQQVYDEVGDGYFGKSSLHDYLGCPLFFEHGTTGWAGRTVDAMPCLAYQKVYMDYYRDRNFVPDDLMEFPVPSGQITVTSGLEGEEFLRLRTRSYLHDYFTSALPFTQRGAEVLMPLAGSGTVSYLDTTLAKQSGTGTPGTNVPVDALLSTGSGGQTTWEPSGGGSQSLMRYENIDEVLLENSNVSINDFRSAYALQVWLERNAIGGSRYTESTQAHFGVKPQDARLQRAEYIGGGRIPVQIREVVSTAYSDDGVGTVPLANLAGHGITYGDTNQFRYFVPEHGFIVSIASIMCPPSYMQGLPRMFRRRTFLDYPWPTFAQLGEQQVDKAELFADQVTMLEGADGILPLFGYQSRYSDWKYVCSRNAGEFRDTLLFWTLTREFSNAPVLGEEFNLFEDATQDRIFAVSGTDNFWMYIHNKLSVKRPLPYFGKPNTMGF